MFSKVNITLITEKINNLFTAPAKGKTFEYIFDPAKTKADPYYMWTLPRGTKSQLVSLYLEKKLIRFAGSNLSEKGYKQLFTLIKAIRIFFGAKKVLKPIELNHVINKNTLHLNPITNTNTLDIRAKSVFTKIRKVINSRGSFVNKEGAFLTGKVTSKPGNFFLCLVNYSNSRFSVFTYCFLNNKYTLTKVLFSDKIELSNLDIMQLLEKANAYLFDYKSNTLYLLDPKAENPVYIVGFGPAIKIGLKNGKKFISNKKELPKENVGR